MNNLQAIYEAEPDEFSDEYDFDFLEVEEVLITVNIRYADEIVRVMSISDSGMVGYDGFPVYSVGVRTVYGEDRFFKLSGAKEVIVL